MNNLPSNIKKAIERVTLETGGYREKEIISQFESYEITNGGKTANIYAEDGNGFQVVITQFSNYKIGDITN